MFDDTGGYLSLKTAAQGVRTSNNTIAGFGSTLYQQMWEFCKRNGPCTTCEEYTLKMSSIYCRFGTGKDMIDIHIFSFLYIFLVLFEAVARFLEQIEV